MRNGWTLQAMAEEMTGSGHKISKVALGQFEKGTTHPKASTLRSLSKVLGIRPSELMYSGFQLDFIGFRSLASMTKTHKNRIVAQMEHMAERRERLCTLAGFDRKPWSIEKQRVKVVEQADELALNVRMTWDLGVDAIGSIVDVVQRNGAEVLELAEDRKFSGLSAHSSDGVPFVAIQRREKDGARQRMDLAHELAHLVLDPKSPVDEEKFAHRFAGAFLLPRETVIAELGLHRRDLNFQELKALKIKYGTSMQAWVRRARDCRVIKESTYKSLMFRISRAGLRSDERAPYVTPEAIDRDLRLAARCVTEKSLNVEDAAELAGLPVEELDDSTMINVKPTRSTLRSLSRAERQKLAQKGARMTAESYRENPQDVVPDIMDLKED